MRIIYNSEVLRTPCSDANSDDHLCSMKAFKQMMSKFVVPYRLQDFSFMERVNGTALVMLRKMLFKVVQFELVGLRFAT